MASILNEMQEISERHGKMLGISRKILDDCGVFWVISRIRVQMQAYPTWGDEIVVATWPHNIGNRIFPRYFRFSHVNGQVLGQATTIYLLMDKETQRITHAPDTIDVPAAKEANGASALELGRLIINQEINGVGCRKPRYSDIDMNNHMNNERYAQWIFDLFEPERFLESRMVSLQINFLAEAKPNEDISLFLYEEHENSWVCGKNADAGTPVFEALCTWGSNR